LVFTHLFEAEFKPFPVDQSSSIVPD